MLQSKKPYDRIYVKSRLAIQDTVILSLRALEYTVRRDALKKALSTFKVDRVPSAISIGDLLILMDAYGVKLYTGIIVRMENNFIECQQIMSLFDDNYLYQIENKATIEETVAHLIETQFQKNQDPIIKAIFSPFQIRFQAGKKQILPSVEEKTIINLEAFLYQLFDDYGILVECFIPFEKAQPTLEIKTDTRPKIKMIDNTVYTPIMLPTEEVYEINKLMVYSDETKEFRGTWFGSRNGITDDPNELTRYAVVKTNIEFSDDPIENLIANHLKDDMYNHKLEIEMIINNLYKFEEMSLGQRFDIWINNRYYKTILTGYEFVKEANEKIKSVKLIFGKVRTKASQRWNVQ